MKATAFIRTLCAVLAVAASSNFVGAGAQAPDPAAADAAKLHVVGPLKNCRAEDVKTVLLQVYGGDLAVVADARTNSVIVKVPPRQYAEIEQVVKHLDTLPAPANIVRTLRPEAPYLDDPRALAEILAIVFEKEGGKFAFDDRGGQLIITGSPEMVEKAVALVKQMVESAKTRRPTNQTTDPNPTREFQLRIVWLASAAKEADVKKVPDDLKAVVAELDKIGVRQVGLIAQTIVNISPNTEFSTEGTAKFGEIECTLKCQGRYTIGSLLENRELGISINALHPSNNPLCNLRTQIDAPPGHFVVLGATPTGETTSVFVVQLLPRKTVTVAPPK